MQTNENKYPLFKAFSDPLFMLAEKKGVFIRLSCSFAFILLLLSFLFGQSYLCTLPHLTDKVHCYSNILLYMLYMLIKLFIFSSFLRIWCDKVFLNKNINIIYLKQNVWRFFKFFGAFMLFLFINSLPAFSLYFMIIRIPNPVWQIEILYFLLMSLGFLIPFTLIRFYKNIALFIEEEPCLNIRQTYEQTNFKVSRIFFAFSIVLAFCLFFFLTVNANLKSHIFAPLYIYNILSEYFFEWSILFVLTIMFNFIMVQKKIFE